MRRSQDIVVARIRTVARRWWATAPTEMWSPEQPRLDENPPMDPTPSIDPSLGAPEGGAPAPTRGRWGSSVEMDQEESQPQHGPGASVAPTTDENAGDEPAHPGPGGPRAWLVLGALVCLVALVVAGGLAVRGWPRPEPELGPPSVAEVDLRPLDEPSVAPSVVVHVAGEVRKPGVVSLPSGARVADALRAAGGLRRGGRLGPTNLARVLSDGERIEIGGQAPDAASGPGGGTSGGPIDLNTATAEQLDELPGVGPVTAAKILAWRTEHGRFSVVDELAEVPGIGPKTLAELRPRVRV
jgi:competence protein ComEA